MWARPTHSPLIFYVTLHRCLLSYWYHIRPLCASWALCETATRPCACSRYGASAAVYLSHADRTRPGSALQERRTQPAQCARYVSVRSVMVSLYAFQIRPGDSLSRPDNRTVRRRWLKHVTDTAMSRWDGRETNQTKYVGLKASWFLGNDRSMYERQWLSLGGTR